MCGKFVCGMLSGLAVGAAAATLYKKMQDKNESTKIKRKAKKLLNKLEQYVNDNMSLS